MFMIINSKSFIARDIKRTRIIIIMSTSKMESMIKQIMQKISIDIQKNTDDNGEQTENNIKERIDILEQHIDDLFKSKSFKTTKDTDSGEEYDEDSDEGEDENLAQSMASKFSQPIQEENASEVMTNIESNILDTNLRIEGLENTVKIIRGKMNELIKVNNAILKRLESTNPNFDKKTKKKPT